MKSAWMLLGLMRIQATLNKWHTVIISWLYHKFWTRSANTCFLLIFVNFWKMLIFSTLFLKIFIVFVDNISVSSHGISNRTMACRKLCFLLKMRKNKFRNFFYFGQNNCPIIVQQSSTINKNVISNIKHPVNRNIRERYQGVMSEKQNNWIPLHYFLFSAAYGGKPSRAANSGISMILDKWANNKISSLSVNLLNHF